MATHAVATPERLWDIRRGASRGVPKQPSSRQTDLGAPRRKTQAREFRAPQTHCDVPTKHRNGEIRDSIHRAVFGGGNEGNVRDHEGWGP